MMEQQARNPYAHGMMPGFIPGMTEQQMQQMQAGYAPGVAMGMPVAPGQPPMFRAPPSMAPPPAATS